MTKSSEARHFHILWIFNETDGNILPNNMYCDDYSLADFAAVDLCEQYWKLRPMRFAKFPPFQKKNLLGKYLGLRRVVYTSLSFLHNTFNWLRVLDHSYSVVSACVFKLIECILITVTQRKFIKMKFVNSATCFCLKASSSGPNVNYKRKQGICYHINNL
jgi:hypothetical protein